MRGPYLLASAWLATCLAVVVGALAVTLAPAETARAWPLPAAWSGAADVLAVALPLSGAAAGLLLLAAAAHARVGRRARPWAELLLFHPLVFAYVWLILGAGPVSVRGWIVGGILAAAAVVLGLRSERTVPRPRHHGRWYAANLALVALPVAVGLAAGHRPDLSAVGLSLLTYPLYAVVQLTVFLAIPSARLQRLGVGRLGVATACTLVFALAHWPNPVVMAATAGAMVVWVHGWLAGRRLVEIALAMGLAATAFSQFLPDDWTHHVRTGPRYVRKAAAGDLALVGGAGRQEAGAWLVRVYPATLGRDATPAELDRWRASLAPAWRTTTAWSFFTSPEYQDRAAAGELPPAPTPHRHWTRLDETWQARIRELGSEEYWRDHGGNREGFLRGLYRDLLLREPSPGGLAAWSTDLTPTQRQRLGFWLLDRRHDLHAAPFDTVGLADLRLGY